MSQLYSLENGILIPYNVSNIVQTNLPNRTDAMRFGEVDSAAQSYIPPAQPDTVRPSNEQQQQVSAPPVQQSNAQQSEQAPAPNDKAYQELYLQAMADLEKQRIVNAQLQVELARQTIIGAANQEAAVDLDSAFDKFFGYTE